MNRRLERILMTGGAGFIGTNFIHMIFGQPGFSGKVFTVDSCSYAGNPKNLEHVRAEFGDRFEFEKLDIRDAVKLNAYLEKVQPDTIIHFAAESHVDRSISGPAAFIETNILGTFYLLEASRRIWDGDKNTLFHHISTDEVFGSLGSEGFFTEETAYDPRSPYSASKASSDHLVQAYHHTYGLPMTLSNCSNNYGPYQFPEKLIPLMILNMLEGKPLPVYGDGRQIRDWLYVVDHNTAVWKIIQSAPEGSSWNIGGENEWENISLVNKLCELVAEKTGKQADSLKSLIRHVEDRMGHDRRYAIDCSKIKNELGWKQSVDFNEGLSKTVDWYLAHSEWIREIQSGEYKEWIQSQYGA
jgi:dTDP-glucose 4,6-dehydratase